jgi:hypothetical protein
MQEFSKLHGPLAAVTWFHCPQNNVFCPVAQRHGNVMTAEQCSTIL